MALQATPPPVRNVTQTITNGRPTATMAQLRVCGKPFGTDRRWEVQFIHCLAIACLQWAFVRNRSKQTEAGNNNLFSKVMEKLVKKATGEMNEIFERFLFNSRNLLLRMKLPVSSGSGVLCECGPRQGTTRQGYSFPASRGLSRRGKKRPLLAGKGTRPIFGYRWAAEELKPRSCLRRRQNK